MQGNFARNVHIVRPISCARHNHGQGFIEKGRASKVRDCASALDHALHTCRVKCVSGEDLDIVCADVSQMLLGLGGVSGGDRPRHMLVVGVHVLACETAGESGGAKDDDIKLPLRRVDLADGGSSRPQR